LATPQLKQRGKPVFHRQDTFYAKKNINASVFFVIVKNYKIHTSKHLYLSNIA